MTNTRQRHINRINKVLRKLKKLYPKTITDKNYSKVEEVIFLFEDYYLDDVSDDNDRLVREVYWRLVKEGIVQ